MQLLDRYLYAVKKHLPRGRSEDILEELRVNILAQAEDKEEQLGRPLNLEEEEGLLKQHGHPMLVAARYLPQQHLIGPMVFPYYWRTLKTAAPWVIGIYVLMNALRFITEPVTADRLVGIVFHFFQVASWVAFWITAVFAAMEFAVTRYVRDPHILWSWSPRKLPIPDPQLERLQPKQPVTDIVLQGIGVAYILAVPQHPFILLGPGAAFLSVFYPAPALKLAYWTVVGLMIAQLATQSYFVVNPSARRALRAVLALSAKVITPAVSGLILYLVPDRQFVLLRDSARGFAGYDRLAANLSNAAYLGLRIVLVVSIVQLLWTAGVLIVRHLQSETLAIRGQ